MGESMTLKIETIVVENEPEPRKNAFNLSPEQLKVSFFRVSFKRSNLIKETENDDSI